MKFKKSTNSSLQLWLMLASIPVMAVVAVYIYGALAFDDKEIIEIDNSIANHDENTAQRLESADLEHEFVAPLDVPSSGPMAMTGQRSTMLPELATTNKEQSLSQMLAKKNENLQIGANGHPAMVRVQENDNLGTLAEQHFGNSVFWPYVFMVNREKLASPTDVKPGMTLFLPDSAYYDININDSLAIKKAIDLGKSFTGGAK